MSKLKLIFLAIPLSFIFNVNINAQSAGMVEEVVVTAQKKEESLQDTPIALTAISESTINDLDIKNGIDLNGIAPNVFLMRMPANNTGMTAAI
ncbi:MAG: TonB-dependent receptor, partial [Gammaproteobacteria bacterium]|nr:TonB-dependent receptor [Gammaproteobacteria bacterium]